MSGYSLLYIRRMKLVLIEVFKLLNKLGPTYLDDILSLKETCYDVRNDMVVDLPRCHTTKYGFKQF